MKTATGFLLALLFSGAIVPTAAAQPTDRDNGSLTSIGVEQEQGTAADLRGIYVYTGDVSTISTGYADMVTASLKVPGVDGIVLVIGWSSLEPAMGQYQWAKLDQWMSAAVSAGKKIDLTVTAGIDTPSWMFQPAPSGAGATPLAFTVSPHGGQTGKCDSETVAAPWDTAFLNRWDLLLAALSAHLKTAGTYGAITLLRLTGINRTTDEFRLPAETPQSTGLACVSDAVTTWQQAGYRPSLLLQGWNEVTTSFQRSFPDKSFSVAIIPQNAFPRIAEDGSVIKGTVPDQNQPLLALASQRFPGRLVVQFNFLMPGEPASPAVIQPAQTLGTLAAFQTNEYFGSSGGGAACSEPVTNPTPCTAATYLELLETGIHPLGEANNLRSQYIEVFPANANAFPADILQAHNELLLTPRDLTPPAQRTRRPSVVPFGKPSKSLASISVCAAGNGTSGSCPSGGLDTHQIVLAPDGSGDPIDKYGGLGATSDEHATVFPPGSLQNNRDYLFWVAAGTTVDQEIGAVVLSAGSGPNTATGQWTMDFARADGYGFYPAGYGPIFLPATGGRCPAVPDGNPAHQDQTFDLSYAAPGTVVKDPSGGPGSLLMIYEGGNSCAGIATATNPGGNAYLTLGVAISLDAGHTWPTYRGTPSFDFVPLPSLNRSAGPHAGLSALGPSVCIGNDCGAPPPATYGRYEVLGPQVPFATAMAAGKELGALVGDGEPSAFADDASANPVQYLYVVHGYKPGTLDPPLANNRTSDLMMARAKFNGGTAPLTFLKWNGQAFATPGVGGAETPILPDGPFQNCAALNQARHQASVSYVEDIQQYSLTFVCDSPADPAVGHGEGILKGSAWFYSTSYDLSDPTQWTPAQEIVGSWGEYDTSGGCLDYKGWYPTLMSLGKKPGHLSTSGYVFYLWGCQGGGAPGGRRYSSRAFTMTIQ